jgi:hypothetical protein
VNDAEERKTLVKSLVDNSGGIFLWTVLVMKQLRDVITVEEVHDVLSEVPQKMSELYRRNITKMETSRSKNLAKHIITWAICAVHPLTVDQMKDAIKLSMDITLARDLRTSLQYLCGQFLDVDKQSRIQMVHQTARAFLTSETLDSEFRIDPPDGHQKIAVSCLKYLLSDDLEYSKRRHSTAAKTASKTSIADYACLRFSEHVFRSPSSSDELFEMLVKFFSTNVLPWIECVAQLRDLDCLIRTSRHLSKWLSRRSNHAPLIPGDLNAWAVDLPRIVTHFGVNLLSNPAAIHTLVPPFCPRDSAIYRHFGHADNGIKLVGAWNSGWDDRIYSVSYHETYATAVTTLDQRFAVGLSDGTIKVYRSSTCEELATIAHEESISILQFGATSKLLASAGLRHVKVWDVTTGNQLYSVSTESQTLSLAFDESETRLMIASRDKHLTVWQNPSGSLLNRIPWTDTFTESKESGFPQFPNAARISIEQGVMVVVYHGKSVQLWSLGIKRPIGACIRQANKLGNVGHIVHFAILNPNPAYQRLVVSYWDEALVTFDINTCKLVASTTAGLDRIALSPNGKTLAGSDGTGGIKIYDFETLQFLQRIPIQGDPITSLAFTSDNVRIIDVRGMQANVWEPSVLVTQDSDSNASEPSESVYPAVDDQGVPTVDQSANITVLQTCEESGMALCGRSNGRVDICNLDDPEKTMQQLYRHRGSFTSVTCIDWAYKPRIAVSADSSGHFRVMQVRTESGGDWGAELLFEAQLEPGCVVNQVLVHPNGSLVLVSSSGEDSVWSVLTKERIASITGHKRTAWKWLVRPTEESQLLLLEGNALKLFTWSDLTLLSISDDSVLSNQVGRTGLAGNADTDAISIDSDGDDLVLAQRFKLQPSQRSLQALSPQTTTTKIYLFDLSSLEPSNLQPTCPSSPSSPRQLSSSMSRSSTKEVVYSSDVDTIIGTMKRFDSFCLLFISRKGWVCSAELSSGTLPDTFQRHFFIPSVWRTGNTIFISKVRRNQDVIFVHNDRVIVVKNGLDIGEHVSFL